MRALLAGIFTAVVTSLVVSTVGSHYPHSDWPWWATTLVIGTMFLSIGASFFIFNKWDNRHRGSGKSFEVELAELEAKGLVTREQCRARRAFEVEEFEDEGAQYFIELEDGSVLFLCSQSLYEYQGSSDESDPDNGRTFPCSEFTWLKHKDGYTFDVICGGKVLPLDGEAPHFDERDIKNGSIPSDGEIFRDRSYDQLKAERFEGSKAR